MTDLYEPGFWAAVGEIFLINMLLSGDNAVVIALACRTLPSGQRRWGMIIGAGVAAGLRIAFTAVVAALTNLPYIKMAGAVALLWVAVRLLEDDDEHGDSVEAADSLWRAIRVIVVADVVMSLDNVIAVAAAANGNFLLLGLGLAMSIPIVIAGSAITMWLLRVFPLLAWAGAVLLGWIAGEIFADDQVLKDWFTSETMARLHTPAALVGAALVLGIGLLRRRSRRTAS